MNSGLFKNLRYSLRLTAALFRKYYLPLAFGAAIGAAVYFAYPKISHFMPVRRGVITIAVIGRNTISDIPLFIQHQLSQGLTTLDTFGFPSPAIAESWQVSDGGRTYTFELNKNLVWQDGTPLVSRDINYQFKDAVTEYPNDYQVVMKLQDPFSPLPVVVSRPVFKQGLLGTGSYKVSRVKRNGSIIDSLTLTPTEKRTRKPNIVYRFYATEAAARQAFKLGDVKSIFDIQDPADLIYWSNAQVEAKTHFDRYVAVFFNTRDDIFSGQSGRNLRLALAYAIDKSRWSNRAYGPIRPTSWAYLDQIKTYELDLNRSRQLLNHVEKVPNEIILSTVPAYLSIAEDIKKDWEHLGINVSVVVSAEPIPDFQALVIAQATPPDPDQYNLWHSTQTTNLTGLDNPRIDKLLEDGRKVTDVAQRKEIYHDLQRFLVDEAPAVFLFHPIGYTVSRK